MRSERGVLIVIAPLLLLIGFGREAAGTDFERPFARPAIYGCLLGVGLHAIARWGASPTADWN